MHADAQRPAPPARRPIRNCLRPSTPTGKPLPAGVQRPSPNYGFVDRAALPPGATITSAARMRQGAVWVVTDQGSFRGVGGKYQPLEAARLFRLHGTEGDIDTALQCIAVSGDSDLGTNHHRRLRGGRRGRLARARPARRHADRGRENPLSGPKRRRLGGTEQGAWRLRGGRFRYFHGKRWLPGNRVDRIWGDDRGRVWLETDGGVSCIEESQITLGQRPKYLTN